MIDVPSPPEPPRDAARRLTIPKAHSPRASGSVQQVLSAMLPDAEYVIHMPISRTESKRVKTFRLTIAKTIPRFPNNKDTLRSLEAMSLGSLLIHYTNWAVRYIPKRPRTVHIESTASSDARWPKLEAEITAFLEKVKNGEDLTLHLSRRPYTRGYTPASSAKGASVDRWADKDFLLNVMGYHHFHLRRTTDARGFVNGTDALLFAKVARNHFTVIGLFDHSVFGMSRSPSGDMTKERERMWTVFDEYSARGRVYMPAMITTSGHCLHLVRRADDYAYVVRETDPKLDDVSFRKCTSAVGCDVFQIPNWHGI